MTNREIALERALEAVVTVACRLGINVTLLDKAKAELMRQAGAGSQEGELAVDAIHEIELTASSKLNS